MIVQIKKDLPSKFTVPFLGKLERKMGASVSLLPPVIEPRFAQLAKTRKLNIKIIL